MSSVNAGRSVKRRKTRKGTRSCWACKRRKVKCTYASPADDVCIGCARRCLDCVGQEFPDQNPGPSSKSRLVGDRIGRLESMIQQLAEQVGGHVASHGSPPSPSTPASVSISTPGSSTRAKYQTLSKALLTAYPSRADLRIIGSTGGNLVLYLAQALVVSSHQLEERVALEAERLWGLQQQQQRYAAETHPALIARQMLVLAILLHHMHAIGFARNSSKDSRYRQLGKLSRPPRVLARRLAEAATTLVTAHDSFTNDNIEGLECLWLEAMYHEHNGSPRQSWLACRRAISATLLMGCRGRRYTPGAPPTSIHPQADGQVANFLQIWHRLAYSELALCLVLEVPPSASHQNDTFTSMGDRVAAEDDYAATTKLERLHLVIARHLIERSERCIDPIDLDAAHQIRTELEEATNVMPSGWWRIPRLADDARIDTNSDSDLFRVMITLRAQIFHSYLLLLAELPSMFQGVCSEPTNDVATTDPQHHNHTGNDDVTHHSENSRDICVKASRDLLRRFIHLRSCERTAGYFRLLDYYAWLAIATLLVTHLLDDPTSLESTDYQQKLSDRAMASEAMEGMRFAEDTEKDEDDGEDENMYGYTDFAAKSGIEDVLSRLLALEAGETAVVVTYHNPVEARSESTRSPALVEGDQDAPVLRIPFVGNVTITPQVQHETAARKPSSPLSGTIGGFPCGLVDEADPQGSGDDGDGEEDDDDDEASLRRAINRRRSSKWWSLAPYMLRP